MKVIKVVNEENNKLVSTFAYNQWQKEYAEGVETKPDVGYLFAYSIRDMKVAKRQVGSSPSLQYWLAEAEVVGRLYHCNIDVLSSGWSVFWKKLKLRLHVKGATYLLCSSITLIRRLT